MIKMEFRDERPSYSFELARKEREMDLCIDIAQCDSRNVARTFKITNKFGIVRFVKSDEIKVCRYIKSPNQQKVEAIA